MNRWLVLFVLGLWAFNALADGINSSGNVGNTGVGQNEGLKSPGVTVAFTPPPCTPGLNFNFACNSQYLLLKFP